MNTYTYDSSQNTLEEHLTNSIRRAKQKIYNQTTNHNQFFNAQLLSSEDNYQQSKNNNEVRNRTSSMRTNIQSHSQKEGKALVGAMKALQERIAILQKQKAQLMNFDKKVGQQGKKDQEIAKLISALKQKQQQIKKLNRVNSNLSLEKNDLAVKIEELQERISRYGPVVQQPTHSNEEMENRSSIEQNLRIKIYEKDIKLAQFNDQMVELQQRNKLSHETIQKLMRQLEQQKKTNKKWIKLLEQQIKTDPKENNSLQGNRTQVKQIKDQTKAKPKTNEAKKDLSQLVKSNKQMYETIKRHNVKMLQMSRQLKQSQERYAKLKVLALELVDITNKVLPNHSQVKFLTVKIMKLENNHIESLRSYSHVSRKSIIQRNSGSKDRKKSLKMSDLNSSQKKSIQKSHSKSGKKTKKDEILLSHSEKKRNFTKEYQMEIEQLQKEVNILKRQHRNLVAKADKGNNQDEDINKKIEETATLYNAKKQKLDELKKQLGVPPKNIRREQTLRV